MGYATSPGKQGHYGPAETLVSHPAEISATCGNVRST